jgi:uncharacterized protein (UPF0332 family)
VSLNGHEQALLRVSKSKRQTLAGFKEGIYLQATTGRPIDELREQACADRLGLAVGFQAMADRLMRTRPPMYRAAVGRYYYAMYHAMRAVVFYSVEGDDHEQHSDVPSKVPHDFPRLGFWQNELKDARLRRNEADYDPYPDQDATFRDAGRHLARQCGDLLTEARRYLQTKGCAFV